MIDLNWIRKAIERAPAPEADAAIVDRGFLEQLEVELQAGRAAMAKLAQAQQVAA